MENSSTIPGKIDRRTAPLGKQLHEAVMLDDINLVKRLLADGAPLGAQDNYGTTALNRAVYKGQVEMVQLLVAEGADKEALDLVGRTPILAAAGKGDHAVTEALLAEGADASFRWHESTALDLAVIYGHVHVLDVSIRHGVDVNHAGRDGTVALHHAAMMVNDPDAVNILAAAGADTETRNQHGFAPLHFAADSLGVPAAVALLKHGADINARERTQRTPLHAAAFAAEKRGAVEMVDLLLKWGADETATDRRGDTPADGAGRRCFGIGDEGGVERVRQLLENAPADRAWRRRGLLVASRARPHMVSLRTSTQAAGAWMDLMGGVLGLVEEEMFRTIVGYL